MGDSRKTDLERRMMALTKYGGSPPVCACCSEDKIEFLSIDHIQGGGKQHLLSIGKGKTSGNILYKWLYKNGYPSGYRVLCYNCNLSRGFYKYCPHEDAEKIAQIMIDKEIVRFMRGAF